MSSCVFGPVLSRRLGRSLGIDLIPSKYCSYNCLYCQLGLTTNLTIERREYIPRADVLNQLQNKLLTNPDYITLSGAGEPTLYLPLDRLISGIKQLTNIPLAVLTNGSLLWLPEVRSALLPANLVSPTLTSGFPETYELINRPHPAITFDKMLAGLLQFRQEFSGLYWLEVFIIKGINDTPAEIEQLAACIKQINPDKVQLNTVTRPPTESYAIAIPKTELEKIASLLSDRAEVVADFPYPITNKEFISHTDDVLDMIKRHPCSLDDLTVGLGLNPKQAMTYINKLLTEQKIVPQTINQKVYYKIKIS